MILLEKNQRQKVIDEALTWLKTPYHHHAGVKGAGVDCLYFIVEVYTAIGVISRPEIPDYPQDIMMHRSEETYLSGLLKYTNIVDAPRFGDIAMWKFGRIYSHAAIVVDWPSIIHSYRRDGGVVLGDGISGELAGRVPLFFSPWGR